MAGNGTLSLLQTNSGSPQSGPTPTQEEQSSSTSQTVALQIHPFLNDAPDLRDGGKVQIQA